MSQSAPTDIDIGRFYTPQPVQRKFHASEARYPLHEGGRGGGKSTALRPHTNWDDKPLRADAKITLP